MLTHRQGNLAGSAEARLYRPTGCGHHLARRKYYGDSFSNNFQTLAPLPDGSSVYAPSTALYGTAGEKVVQKGHLLHMAARRVLVPNSSPAGYDTACPRLVSPRGCLPLFIILTVRCRFLSTRTALSA